MLSHNPTITEGASIPADAMLVVSGAVEDPTACALPQKTTSAALFANKKAVIVGIPIPFSPTCHLQQLPGFVKHASLLKSKGIDTIAVINTYDIFVQHAWGKDQKVGAEVLMVSDPLPGGFLTQMGLVMDISGMPVPLASVVSKRFAMVVEDMKVTYLGVDEKGFEKSSVEAVLARLKAASTLWEAQAGSTKIIMLGHDPTDEHAPASSNPSDHDGHEHAPLHRLQRKAEPDAISFASSDRSESDDLYNYYDDDMTSLNDAYLYDLADSTTYANDPHNESSQELRDAAPHRTPTNMQQPLYGYDQQVDEASLETPPTSADARTPLSRTPTQAMFPLPYEPLYQQHQRCFELDDMLAELERRRQQDESESNVDDKSSHLSFLEASNYPKHSFLRDSYRQSYWSYGRNDSSRAEYGGSVAGDDDEFLSLYDETATYEDIVDGYDDDDDDNENKNDDYKRDAEVDTATKPVHDETQDITYNDVSRYVNDKRDSKVPPKLPIKNEVAQSRRAFTIWDAEDVELQGLKLESLRDSWTLSQSSSSKSTDSKGAAEREDAAANTATTAAATSKMKNIPTRGSSHSIYTHVLRSNSIKPSTPPSFKSQKSTETLLLPLNETPTLPLSIQTKATPRIRTTPSSSPVGISPSSSSSILSTSPSAGARYPTPPLIPQDLPTSSSPGIQIDKLIDQSLLHLTGPNQDVLQAISVLKEARSLAKVTGDVFREAQVQNNLATAWRRLGRGTQMYGALDAGLGLVMEVLGRVVRSVNPAGWKGMEAESLQKQQQQQQRGEEGVKGVSADSEQSDVEKSRIKKLTRLMRMLILCGLGSSKSHDASRATLQTILPTDLAPLASLSQLPGSSGKSIKGPSLTQRLIGAISTEANIRTLQPTFPPPPPLPRPQTQKDRPPPSPPHPHPPPPTDKIYTTLSPPLLVLLMNLCTSFGNAHFTFNLLPASMRWHQACLDIAHDTLLTFPLPPRPQNPALSVSFLHANCLRARARSFSLLGVCIQRLGDTSRGLRFQSRALESMELVRGGGAAVGEWEGRRGRENREVEGGVLGNLAAALFESGRLTEAMGRGVEAAKVFEGLGEKRELRRCKNNLAVCVLEGGRVGGIVQSILKGGEGLQGEKKGKGRIDSLSRANKAIVVPKRKMSLSIRVGPAIASNTSNRIHSAPPTPTPSSSSSSFTSLSPLQPPSPSTSFVESTASRSQLSTRRGSQDAINTRNNGPKAALSAIKESETNHAHVDISTKETLQSTPADALSETIQKATTKGSLWSADVLKGLRMLRAIVQESIEEEDAEMAGFARFNYAAGLILLHLPYKAALTLFESPQSWSDMLLPHTTPQSEPTAFGLYALLQASIRSSHVLFNMTQILWLIAFKPSHHGQVHITDTPTHLEQESVSYLLRILHQLHPITPNLTLSQTIQTTLQDLQNSQPLYDLLDKTLPRPPTSSPPTKSLQHPPPSTPQPKPQTQKPIQPNTSKTLPRPPPPPSFHTTSPLPLTLHPRVSLALWRAQALSVSNPSFRFGSPIPDGWVGAALSRVGTEGGVEVGLGLMAGGAMWVHLKELEGGKREEEVGGRVLKLLARKVEGEVVEVVRRMGAKWDV
ncbi:hypothetical protein HDV05_007576 [Chytridiales sp. JEL 0842]|nr:hypothetical protein HDV05_007576 [Chytridiales sp. JEL 0842]